MGALKAKMKVSSTSVTDGKKAKVMLTQIMQSEESPEESHEGAEPIVCVFWFADVDKALEEFEVGQELELSLV